MISKLISSIFINAFAHHKSLLILTNVCEYYGYDYCYYIESAQRSSSIGLRWAGDVRDMIAVRELNTH